MKAQLFLNKDDEQSIEFNKLTGKWELIVNNQTKHSFLWKEIRASIAFRAWCFKTQKESDEFQPKSLTNLTLDSILQKLVDDLQSRNLLSQSNIPISQMDLGKY